MTSPATRVLSKLKIAMLNLLKIVTKMSIPMKAHNSDNEVVVFGLDNMASML